MKPLFVVMGVLLAAAPLFPQDAGALDPHLHDGKLDWLLLTETPAEIARRAGPPRLEVSFGSGFLAWQYRFGSEIDRDDFSHYLVFEKSSGSLVAITRSYASQQNVDELFPEAETSVYEEPNSRFHVRVRRLSGGRMLLAMGAAKPGDRTDQLVLIRANTIRNFYPWLANQLDATGRH